MQSHAVQEDLVDYDEDLAQFHAGNKSVDLELSPYAKQRIRDLTSSYEVRNGAPTYNYLGGHDFGTSL